MLWERCEGVRVLGRSFYSCAGLRWVRWVVAVANPRSREDVSAGSWADVGVRTSAREGH
jgi:hypothetical protein